METQVQTQVTEQQVSNAPALAPAPAITTPVYQTPLQMQMQAAQQQSQLQQPPTPAEQQQQPSTQSDPRITEHEATIKTLQQQLLDMQKASNQSAAETALLKAGINLETLPDEAKAILPSIVTADAEQTKTQVNALIAFMTAHTQAALQQAKLQQITAVPLPNVTPEQQQAMTFDTFSKLSYAEQVELKNSNPELVARMLATPLPVMKMVPLNTPQ